MGRLRRYTHARNEWTGEVATLAGPILFFRMGNAHVLRGFAMVTAVIVSQGSQPQDRSGPSGAQALFSPVAATILAIQTTLTPTRFNRYVADAGGDLRKALALYRWNSFLAHSLYWPSQMLEIAARNSIANVLTIRFGSNWHLSSKFERQLGREDKAKLDEAVTRQQRDRKTQTPPVDAVIADLSFGFWTSMLTTHYAIPLGWAKTLRVAFPNLPNGLVPRSVLRPMEDVRVLRNRIAHHEPIYDRRLDVSHREMLQVLGWICPDTQWYVEHTSIFPEVWASPPT